MNKVFLIILLLTALDLDLFGAQSLRKMRGVKKNFTVLLDPGHGGDFKGCPSFSGKYFEKDMTLDISLRVEKILKKNGVTVKLTRDKDINFSGDLELDLQRRVDMARLFGANFLISIHLNSAPNKAVRGFELFIPELRFVSQSKEFADQLRLELLKNAKKDKKYDSRWDRGIKIAPFYLLKNAYCPSVLVELEFITNPEGEKIISIPGKRQQFAEIIAQTIIKYKKQNHK